MLNMTFLVTALMAQTTTEPTSGLTLIAGAKSDYRIRRSGGGLPVHEYAAKELQDFLAEMSGVRLAIIREGQAGQWPAIRLGSITSLDRKGLSEQLGKLKEDGVLIKTVGRDLVLMGQNDAGSSTVSTCCWSDSSAFASSHGIAPLCPSGTRSSCRSSTTRIHRRSCIARRSTSTASPRRSRPANGSTDR